MTNSSSPVSQMPRAAQKPHSVTFHGDTRNDPYAWLKDPNWQEVMQDPARLDPDIRTYLEAENEFLKAALASTEELQETIFKEMRGRIKEDESSVPAPDGPFAYYTKYRTGGQHPLICRQSRTGGDSDEVLLDGDKEAEGQAFFKIASAEHSPDHKLLAYGVDDKGSEYFAIHVRDLETGRNLPDKLDNTTGAVVWSADGQSFFYVAVDNNHRPTKVYRHAIGSDPATDKLIYNEKDSGFFVGVSLTESRRFVIISSHDHETSEVYLIPADEPDAQPKLVAQRETGVEYDLSHIGDLFLILTNVGGAEDFKIMEAPVSAPGRENWRERIPHEPGRLILNQLTFTGHHVRLERVDSLPQAVVTTIGATGAPMDEHVIRFDEEAFSLSLMPGLEFDTETLRFAYSSPTTPEQVFDYDMKIRQRELRKTQEVPSGHDPADYVTRRVMASAQDGEDVPVTVLHHKTTALDGTAPLLLYGYGSYGYALPAGFSTGRLSLVDRGFVYALAHIRGGKDRGYRWYRQGKRDAKKNTFTDFIAAAETLIAQDYTSKGAVIAHGGSAGGMLMGAVANMAPDLFNGIIADVPFVDVLNTMCDETLPLTPPEWPEWGNPITDKLAYDYIKSYSPYDNVVAQDYPNILVTAGLTDPRVTYWEPAKWVAKLRATKTDDRLLLLKTNMEAGHAGAAGRFDHLKEVALTYAFACLISEKMS